MHLVGSYQHGLLGDSKSKFGQCAAMVKACLLLLHYVQTIFPTRWMTFFLVLSGFCGLHAIIDQNFCAQDLRLLCSVALSDKRKSMHYVAFLLLALLARHLGIAKWNKNKINKINK